jgi:hypothetical protein
MAAIEMDAAVPFSMIALIVFIVGVVLVAAAIGSTMRRQRYARFDTLGDDITALRVEIDRLRERIDRLEERSDLPKSDAFKK